MDAGVGRGEDHLTNCYTKERKMIEFPVFVVVYFLGSCLSVFVLQVKNPSLAFFCGAITSLISFDVVKHI